MTDLSSMVHMDPSAFGLLRGALAVALYARLPSSCTHSHRSFRRCHTLCELSYTGKHLWKVAYRLKIYILARRHTEHRPSDRTARPRQGCTLDSSCSCLARTRSGSSDSDIYSHHTWMDISSSARPRRGRAQRALLLQTGLPACFRVEKYSSGV